MVVLGIVTEVMVLPGFTEHACCQIDRRWSNVPRFATEALFRLRRMHGYAYCFFFYADCSGSLRRRGAVVQLFCEGDAAWYLRFVGA